MFTDLNNDRVPDPTQNVKLRIEGGCAGTLFIVRDTSTNNHVLTGELYIRDYEVDVDPRRNYEVFVWAVAWGEPSPTGGHWTCLSAVAELECFDGRTRELELFDMMEFLPEWNEFPRGDPPSRSGYTLRYDINSGSWPLWLCN